VQASLDYKQRLQQLFFPEGIAFDGNRFNRTAATAPLFNYLAPSESADEKMVSLVGIEPVLTPSLRPLPRVETLLIPQDICSVWTVPERARLCRSAP
jgi:hypothetical protein